MVVVCGHVHGRAYAHHGCGRVLDAHAYGHHGHVHGRASCFNRF